MTRLLTNRRHSLTSAPPERLEQPKPKRSSRPPRPPSPINPISDPCELAPYSEHKCEGLVVRCHIIKEQWLLDRLGLDREEANHRDFWLVGCNGIATPHGGHHLLFDRGELNIDRRDIGRLRPGLEVRARQDPRIGSRLDVLYGLRPGVRAA